MRLLDISNALFRQKILFDALDAAMPGRCEVASFCKTMARNAVMPLSARTGNPPQIEEYYISSVRPPLS